MAGERLSSYAEIVMGQSPPGDTCNTSGNGLPLLNGPTEYGPHHPTPVQFTTDARKRASQGDILFCVRGSTTGRMNWADREYAIGRGVAAIRHKTKPTLQPFVRSVIEYGLPGLLAQATGSTFPNVSASQLADLPWPPLDDNEQQAIASILGMLDDKIELNRRMNQTIEAMGRALFKSWFVDFDPVRAKAEGRDPGLPKAIADLFPDSFEDNPLVPIPKGWRVVTLADLSEKPQYGYTASASDEPIGPKFLRITDLNKQEWIDWQNVPFCPIDERDHGKYALHTGDIVIARMADPGHGAMIEEDIDAVFASYLIRFRPRQPELGRFLQYWLRSESYWNLVRARQSGTTRANLNAQVLSAFSLVVPERRVLQAFSTQVGALRHKLVANVRETRTLAALRDTLLPKLISGELRVKDAKSFLETRKD